MDKIGKVLIIALVVLVIGGPAIVSWLGSFPMTIEGKVVVVKYDNTPPFPFTRITFTSLGDASPSVCLAGTIDRGIKIGSTYRITYYTPFFWFYATPIEIKLLL